MLARDLSTWEQMKDASGRVYLADRVTGSSKWLWVKWDLNGQVFCENLLTKERRWPQDMDISLKVAAGVANAAELKMYRGGSSQPPVSQAQHMYNGGAGAQHTQRAQYRDHRQQPQGYAGNGEQQQRRSYASVTTGNGGYGGYGCGQQQTSIAQTNASYGVETTSGSRSGSGYGSSTHTASLSNARNDCNAGHGGGGARRYGWGWGGNSDGMYKHTIPTPNHAVGGDSNPNADYALGTKDSNPKSVCGLGSKDSNPNSAYGVGSNPNPVYGLSQSSQMRRNTPGTQSHTHTHTVHVNSKRTAQNDAGRYWQPLKTQPMKRSGRNATNSRTNKSVFRTKPIPITNVGAGLNRSPRRKFAPSTSGARKLLKIATSLTNAHIVAAMHERDFAIGIGGLKVSNATEADESAAAAPVIGTCMDLEKDFLRLTSAPKPEFVRPPTVLKMALSHVMKRWERREHDYDWVCRQLKAIRQDYKVQHVESSDSLETYETHARLALQNGDLGEFNTCVAQAQDLHGKAECGATEQRKDEFAAYRILYNTVVAGSSYEQARLLSDFTPGERARGATAYALAMRAAFRNNNYIRFFSLFANPPVNTHIPYLAQRLVPAARSKAFAAMVISYALAKPSHIPLTTVLNLLGFTGPPRDVESQVSPHEQNITDEDVRNLDDMRVSNESVSFKQAVLFLLSINAVILRSEDGELVIDCKATKLKGVAGIDHQRGLITHAGGQ